VSDSTPPHSWFLARLEELRLLKDGWLDGEGFAPNSSGLDWLEASVRDHYSASLPPLRIYPVPDGQVLFEWSIHSKAASLEIDLSNRTGYWHILNLETREDSDESLDLGRSEGWKALAERLTDVQGASLSTSQPPCGCRV
jgi:hypothetical protein